MKKYLYFNYYRDTNPARRDEYLYCVRANLSHDFIDGYMVFLDDQSHAADIPQDPRVQFVTLGRRMEFQDAIDHARNNLDDGSVIIIINLDIFLANGAAWNKIDQDFFHKGHPNKAMVCTRHNFKGQPSADKVKVEIEKMNWVYGNYCDAWVLSTPFEPRFAQENFHFCVGHAPQCDNLMMGIMSRHLHTYSWGAKYHIMHLDICRSLDFDQKKAAHKDTMDTRARDRYPEHRNIPTQQPWQRLLESGQAPMTTYTWFDYTRAQ